MIDRREFVLGVGATHALTLAGCGTARDRSPRVPVAFVSHGAPTLALDAERGRELRRWARSMPEPTAILVVSAHWERSPVVIGTTRPSHLLYDFGGFDARLRTLRYEAPGAPELASRLAKTLDGVARDESRMWDHGVWVPLLHMFPAADVPVLQVSLPDTASTRDAFALGASLRPLREEGVLVVASGGLVHNLRALDWNGASPVPGWATEFESWVTRNVLEHDVDALLDLERAPSLRRAHPTLEHVLPLLVALGAAGDERAVTFPITGFEYGSLSRTCVQFG